VAAALVDLLLLLILRFIPVTARKAEALKAVVLSFQVLHQPAAATVLHLRFLIRQQLMLAVVAVLAVVVAAFIKARGVLVLLDRAIAAVQGIPEANHTTVVVVVAQVRLAVVTHLNLPVVTVQHPPFLALL
jgi:hypothetical protein